MDAVIGFCGVLRSRVYLTVLHIFLLWLYAFCFSLSTQVFYLFFFFLMIRRPPRSTHCISSAASDVYKRQVSTQSTWGIKIKNREKIFHKMESLGKKVPIITLNTGAKMPQLGLGTWLTTNESTITDLLREAIKLGYRHIDTALGYDNHKIIGGALATIFKEGLVKREELFITTKIFPFKNFNAIEKLEESLKDLQLTYVDLFLVHWPFAFLPQEKDTPIVNFNHKPQHIIWYEMEECCAKGLTKQIGVSNYNVQSLVNVLSFCKIKPSVNQVELSPFLQQPHLIDFCKRAGIAVTAYSPLARGGVNQPVVCGDKPDILNNPILMEIAKKHKKNVVQVVLNYMTKHMGVIVIPKTEKVERLKENLNVFDFELAKEEVEKIKSLDAGIRTIKPQELKNFAYIDMFA
eukprot:TRINITY_DN998_c0_g3_i1.p1 TRINITY_DN998_c0_g3~~TRINITY_DN998_c0_g3_i1.p1  ORF type:complete len:405 (-),score=94.31 TRINITY_DN998_c0_g3_i1:267-1481(-)